MAFTVTATQSGSSANRGVYLLIQVLTSATESGGASNGGDASSNHNAQGSLTPNFSGSRVVFSISEDNTSGGMGTAVTNNTYDSNNGNTTDFWSSAEGHYSGTVTGGTALTYGESTNTGNDHANWCAYEVPGSGGSPVVDGSSPALASTTTAATVTTASFSPPAGSVLALMVVAGGTGSGTGITMTISDTSGLGLTWTQRAVSSSSDAVQPTWIYTTTIPAGGAAGPAVSPAKPGKTWLRRYRHRQRVFPPPQVPALPAPSGSVPGGVIYRRRPARALVAGLAAAPIIAHAVTGGVVAQRSPAQRHRAVVASSTARAFPNGSRPGGTGIYRRRPARGAWQQVTGQPPAAPGPAGSPPGGLVIRRQASGVTWGGLASSRVQAPVTAPAGSQPGGVVRRRAPARAVTAGRAVPPRIAVPVTGGLVRRRAAARAVTAHITGKAYPNGSKPGGVVYRRRPARVVTGHAYGAAYQNGAKPGGVVAWRRPIASRGLWAHVYGQPPPIPPGPAGSQPGGLVVRRQPQQRPRVTWKGLASPLVSGATLITLTDVAAATDLNAPAVTAAVALPDTAGAVEWQYADGSRADVAAAVDQITVSAQTVVADVAAATDAVAQTAAVPLGDVAGAADSVLSGEPTAPADVAGSVEGLTAQVTAPEAEVAAATEALSVQKPATGPVATWGVGPCQPRWQTQPTPARWKTGPAGSRWSLQPALSLWSLHPASLRWRIIMAVFDPISALSAEDVNVTWTSSLDGTSVDPTQAPFAVQFAFPLSSGNQQRPAEPVTWYTGQWLAGGTAKGYVAQCPVGPGTTGPTLTAGQSYDVWSQVTGTNEQPVKYAGTLQVY